MRLLFIISTFLATLPLIWADYDNFPVKSLNVDRSPVVEYYKAVDNIVDDAHPVYGIMTSDGAYVLVGKGIGIDSFAVKFSAAGTVDWKWVPGWVGDDVANSVVQLPTGDIVVVGYRTVNSIAKRYMTKLLLTTGSVVWTMDDFGDASATSNGAWEWVGLDTKRENLLLGGVHRKPDRSEMLFKSYGNVPNGEAIALAFPVSELGGAAAPGGSRTKWSYSQPVFNTVKSVKHIPGKDELVILLYKDGGSMASLARLNSETGSVVWGPTHFTQHGEGTDVVVVGNDEGFVVSGHGNGGVAGGLRGRLTKITSSGVHSWSKSYYSTPGTVAPDIYIKNECWGLQALSTNSGGGFVVGCGTGIENCDGMTGQYKTDCVAGRAILADTRSGAYPRQASIWQSMVFQTDSDGTEVWRRVDQYRVANTAKLGTAGWQAGSSASEYIILGSDGSIVSVNDEAIGVGLLKFGASANSGRNSSNGRAGGPNLASGVAVSHSVVLTIVIAVVAQAFVS